MHFQKTSKTKANIQCFKFGRYRHHKSECRATSKQYRKEIYHWRIKNSTRFDHGNFENAMIARRTRIEADPIAIDSGATCHMLKNQKLFSSMKRASPKTVINGNGKNLSSNDLGTGLITFYAEGGGIRSLQL